MIQFSPLNHSYKSVDQSSPVDWISVTSFIHSFQPRFDSVKASEKASKNSRSKWYKIPPDKIREIWKGESRRSLNMGTLYHDATETDILSQASYSNLKVVAPTMNGEDKIASNQLLENNSIYPEHLAYLQSYGICGQADRVDVRNNKVNIRDYKTSKAIKMEGFASWEGITERMTDPLSHLDNCNFVHFSLQLSLYLFMILRHNPQLSPGDLIIEHIIFEQESEDLYGYPVYKKNEEGHFIVNSKKLYPVPYLKSEIMSMLNCLNENRDLIKKIINEKKSDN